MPGLNILDSLKGIFTSYNFGNVVAGASTAEKLLFVSSTGVGTASASEFGVKVITGNDGYNFAQVCAGQGIDGSLVTAFSGTAMAGSGTISGRNSGSMIYAVSTIDAFGNESSLENATTYAPSMTVGIDTYAIALAWGAISGTSTYGVYLSLDTGSTYHQVTTTAAYNYTDTSGTATATDPQASGSVSYRPSGSWASGTGSISLGDMAAGAILPVFVKEVVPSGTTSANNPRQHYVYTRHTV